jgi:hypothetical protein
VATSSDYAVVRRRVTAARTLRLATLYGLAAYRQLLFKSTVRRLNKVDFRIFTSSFTNMADTNQPAQPAAQGSGPKLERRYFIDILRPKLSPVQLMQAVQADLPRFSPGLLADFEQTKGTPGALHIGDEFHIKILGPWNGSVRVTEVATTAFELITLEGHPEAGRIRFEVHALDERPGELRFEIHSVARSRDGLVAFAYDTIGGGKLMQEATWVEFCTRVAEASGGQAQGPITVETTRHSPDGPIEQTRHHA